MPALKQLVIGKQTDKDTVHSYIDVYDRCFAPRQHSAQNVLELGIYQGGSLLLWHDYFPNALVTGVDVTPAQLDQRVAARIRTLVCDAYHPDALQRLGDRTYDVILDDGPHTLESMLFVAAQYTPLLAPDGILVIEDVQDIGWVPAIRNAFPEHVRDRVCVLDRRGVKGRYDDILIVLDLSGTVE